MGEDTWHLSETSCRRKPLCPPTDVAYMLIGSSQRRRRTKQRHEQLWQRQYMSRYVITLKRTLFEELGCSRSSAWYSARDARGIVRPPFVVLGEHPLLADRR